MHYRSLRFHLEDMHNAIFETIMSNVLQTEYIENTNLVKSDLRVPTFNWFNFLGLTTPDYWTQAQEFVQKVTERRDESHGYQHMKIVAQDTLRILHLTDPNLL